MFLKNFCNKYNNTIRKNIIVNKNRFFSTVDKHGSDVNTALINNLSSKTNQEIVDLVDSGKISQYKLEDELKISVENGENRNCYRAVKIRRIWLENMIKNNNKGFLTSELNSDEENKNSNILPFGKFDFRNFYQQVLGKNCENVIGYIPIPVGFVGPLKINNCDYQIPLATTEGALLASANRGSRAITESGGAFSYVYNDGMTRAPVLLLPSSKRAVEMKEWIELETNFSKVKSAFESTTNFGKLKSIKPIISGKHIFLRFVCQTGDAMGMNMISKGCMKSLEVIKQDFPEYQLLAVSGNVCTDKKPSSINWTEGRGKSVVAEVVLKKDVIKNVLKCDIPSLVKLNTSKNLIGSAVAGSIGGNNAHASNLISALFLATGQDPAQNVESSNCITLMEPVNNEQDLHVSVTLPSIEVGTIGGGTSLSAQKSCLQMLGLSGAHQTNPGQNAKDLSKIVAGSVLAGEISLMSALASNHLVSAHMELNR